MGRSGAVRGMVPAYSYPETAARAVGHAVRYGAWRARPPGTMEVFPGLRRADARALVMRFLGRLPGGGWLPPGETSQLLGCYGVPLVPTRLAADAEEAVAVAAELGGMWFSRPM